MTIKKLVTIHFPLWKRGIEGESNARGVSNKISPNPSFPKRGTECLQKLLLLGALLLVISTLGWTDELVVIAHLDSGINQLNRAELVNLYLGRSKKLASGITALPVDLSAASPQKKMFYEQLVNKPLPEIQAYWARLLFTGLSTPPRQANNVNEALELVSHNQGAIAYIDRRQVKPSVKIVFEFKP